MSDSSGSHLTNRSLVVLSPGVPHKSLGASSVLFFHYIHGIASAGCSMLHLLLIDPSNADPARLDEYVREVGSLRNLTVVPCVLPRLYGINRWTRAPYVGPLPADVLSQVERFAPDHVVAFDVLCAAYADQIAAGTRIVWLGDLNFESFWYHALYEVRERPSAVVRLAMTAIDCLQWKQFYRRVLSDFNSIIVASKSSETSMRRLGLSAKYLPYPWPVSDASLGGGAGACSEKPTFTFFGSLSGLGSRSAFHMLLSEVYPELVRVWGPGGFEIVLAGSRQLPEWVKRSISWKPEVVFKGFVDDLAGLLRTSHAAVIPIAVPVGNRSRIVTAMAHRAVVIAHRNTARGNPHLVSGENCLLASDAHEFVKHMRFVVEAPGQVKEIRKRARETYDRNFAPSMAVPQLLCEIEALPLVRRSAHAYSA